MSDPVTNVDIEDVLASIRRLVLTGGPPGAAALGAAPTPARSRLVLTPAQRVGEDDGEASGEAPEDEPAARAPLLVLSAPMVRAQPDPDLPAPPDEAAATPEPIFERAPRANGRVSGARGIEAAVTGRAEAWDPDGNEEALDWSLGGVAFSSDTLVFSHRLPVEPPTEPAAPTLRSSPPPERVAPERTLGDRRASDRMFAPEDFEPPATEPPAASVPDAEGVPDEAPARDPAHDMVMVDEAQLRAIVTEVLRAELQGELGERITRNVRRLVRREIFRVLEIREDE